MTWQRSLFDPPPRDESGAIALRPYQHDALAQLAEAFAAGRRAPLLVLPCGAGKTVVAAELMRRELGSGKRALFLAPRRELIHQAHEKLDALGIQHGTLLAGAEYLRNLYALAQVASFDTLISRMVRRRTLELVEPDLVIIDEAHLSITTARAKLLELWPRAHVVGLTATPTRKDGRALGAMYDTLIEPVTTAELTAQGYLAPARYFSVSEPDLERLKVAAGDYAVGELDAVVNRAELVGDIVAHWLAHASDRRTVVFCCSISHSAAMADAFQRAGVAAEHIDALTPPRLREETFGRFVAGETQVLTNCQLATYGFDLPALSCVVLARPTRSLMLYLQMVGRGLRIAPDKSDCLVLDHSGAVHRHGFADDERHWTLEGNRALVERSSDRKRSPTKSTEVRLIECPECDAVFTRSRECPECGYFIPPRGVEVTTLDGELVAVGHALEPDEQERLAFFLELRGLCAERGWKPGAAAHKFRERFGAWPPRTWNSQPPAQPTLATRRWVLSRQIARAKARARDQAGAQS